MAIKNLLNKLGIGDEEMKRFGIPPLLGLILLIIVTSGCGSSTSKNSASSNTNNTTIQQPSSSQSSSQRTTADEQADANKVKEIKQKLLDNYGGAGNPKYETSWYSLIKDIEVYKDTVYVKTSIYHDDEGKKIAQIIANAIYNFKVEAIEHVEVDASDKMPIAVNK